MSQKVALHTLGCKLNFSETSTIGNQFLQKGFSIVDFKDKADVYVFNTCTVTENAEKECRQLVRKVLRSNPEAYVIVTGCYAQLKPDEISKISGVDLVLGSNEKFSILEFLRDIDTEKPTEVHTTKINQIKEFKPSCSSDDRTRYFLKVQDGCDYYCTYCTIPFARGRSRSASVAETIERAMDAIDLGAKEIVLTGVNIGDFGVHTNENFFDLVKALDNIDKDVRFRISSIEPNLLTDEIIEFVKSSKRIMPHFHIPLQSGTNEVLTLMKRKYNRELFAQKVELIKSLMPHAFIGVDVIVGVRGETAELFEESCKFIDSLDISQLHVFTYSERAGTKMLDIEQSTPLAERKKRSDILHLLSDKKTKKFYESQKGKTYPVLWESRQQGDKMVGFTSNYVQVECKYDKKLVNVLETIILGDWNEEKSALIKA